MDHNMTWEELTEILYETEHFVGRVANMNKVMLYWEIKDDLIRFERGCDKVQAVHGFDPNPRERHAILWMDFVFVAMLNAAETAELTSIMAKADAVTLTGAGDHVRICFDVRDIWAE